MGLYTVVDLEPEAAAVGPNVILQGNLIAIPIDMTSTLMTSIDLSQMSQTQDYSLRAWLSVYKTGIAINADGDQGGHYAVMKYGWQPIVIYTISQIPPDESFKILVTPGKYFLNILNLTNEINLFGFMKTDS